jgi:glycosyltransferase involved in cell wall biosynthesis
MRAENSLPLEHETVLVYHKRILSRLLTRVPYPAFGVAPRFHRRVAATHGEILHAHFATDATTALPLISYLNLPTVVTLHGYDVTVRDDTTRTKFAGSLYLRARPQLWKKAHLFLCVSEFIRQRALQAGFPEEKLKVHYIGIDRKVFTPQRGPREPLVVFVGRLVEKKGCSYLLQAMKKVQQQMPQARLAVIGFGPLRIPLEKMAGELGVRAEFLGRKSGSEVRSWFGRARVVCVPSVTAASGDSEGLPTVIMEANAIGVPVVGFRHAGIPEIVKHNETGLLYTERDADALATGLLRCLTDDAFWTAASEAGIKQVGDKFDLSTQTAKLEEVYNQLIAMNVMDTSLEPRTRDAVLHHESL